MEKENLLAENSKAELSKTIEILLQQAFALRGENFAKAMAITEEALSISAKNGLANLEAKAKNQLALCKLIQGDFDTAMQLSCEALQFFEYINDRKGIANSRYNIGSILYRTDNFHQGLQQLLECLLIYQDEDDYANQARVLKSMGTIYEYFNDYENATKAYLQCIEVSRKVGDVNAESNAYNPLSGLFLKNGDIDKALEIIEKSVAIKNETKDKRGLAFALYGRGKVWLKQNKVEDAIRDFEESLVIQTEANDTLGMGMVLNKLGTAQQLAGNVSVAKEKFLKALQIGEKHNSKFILFKAHYNLYRWHKNNGDVQEALRYLENYVSMKESVINSATQNVIQSYEALSKIKTLEQETKSQKEKNTIIEEKNRELDSFFYRVSHDLKGPISSLLGLHQVVQVDVQDETALLYLNMYHHQVQRINNIVLNLIDITRMKHLEVKKEAINFNVLVEECILSYQHFTHFKSIRFIKEIEQEIHFQSEWAIVNTILQNLIENAIKYIRPNVESWVRIAVFQNNHNIHIVVEDNGQGIPEHHQQKIFDMFHRANDRVQGSGLGLYILKRAVERLHGTIELKSVLHEGSLFTVSLPC